MFRCPSCNTRVQAETERRTARCSRCREPLYEPPYVQRPAEAGEATCTLHAGNKATNTCDRCGNFMCAVCRTRFGGAKLCAACVERVLQARTQQPAAGRAEWTHAVLSVILGLV